jgi:hypothetical protein
MPMYEYERDLIDQLGALAEQDDRPATVDLVELAKLSVGEVERRVLALVDGVSEVAGLDLQRPEIENRAQSTRARLPGELLVRGFHASGAIEAKLAVRPFEDVFDADPGDEQLTALAERALDGLGLRSLLPEQETLTFERLWRIKAAGVDLAGNTSAPVLCRAVGAFRHSVRDLPVLGRASATVRLAAGGRLVSTGLSMRRMAGDDGGGTIATVAVRRPDAAAEEVAARVARSFGGLEDLGSARISADSFRFGYLDLGRRKEQAMLAPFYVASVTIEHEHERTAQLVAVAGSDDQYLRLPSAERPAASPRPAVIAA